MSDKIIYILCGCLLGYGILGLYLWKNVQSEEISLAIDNALIIDSLKAVNDSIKIKVEHLDSIKNAEIIEVSTLNNDSTLKLFYKLVKE